MTDVNATDFTTPAPYMGPPTLGYNRRGIVPQSSLFLKFCLECTLNAVGIPVLHAESQYGEVCIDLGHETFVSDTGGLLDARRETD